MREHARKRPVSDLLKTIKTYGRFNLISRKGLLVNYHNPHLIFLFLQMTMEFLRLRKILVHTRNLDFVYMTHNLILQLQHNHKMPQNIF